MKKTEWTHEELLEEFVVHDIRCSVAIVTRKSDQQLGSVEYTGYLLSETEPRVYSHFMPADRWES